MREIVFRDDETGHRIEWNGFATFNVYSEDGPAVNVFTNYSAKGQSLFRAREIAREWWTEYGRENTAELEREGL